ncbi:MAG: Co2+/Mg2+ efflux protein ApaG [Deltaproteobacteria bacterium CG2_30_63_29]|nr:MAG: Co2+/Mg2+ efflux protein ApaG [Deltaproteobacteria bacterium CG2_30_63_29]PJB48475.1 MAG: Co2+/Mg2+ efflux protein ApaG [Deltaproteobacteria bacterium CG_4_9_14_3_um_filter_63_12]
MSDTTTNGIRIRVQTTFLPERSTAEHYFFAYNVLITNEGDEASQLLDRHWVITDGAGRTQEVKGAGVVGCQPLLEPNGVFEYTSFCPLTTPVGTMTGSYTMRTSNGETFQAAILPFTLAVPHTLN